MKHVIKHRLLALCSAGLLALTTALAVAPQVQGNAETAGGGNKTVVSERDLTGGYFELLDGNSWDDLKKWFIEEKGLDLNEDSAYIDENFNSLLFEAIDEGIVLDVTNPRLRLQLYGHVHLPIYSMDGVLQNDGKHDVRNFINGSEGGYNFSNVSTGLYAPDEKENENFSAGHFYVQNNPKIGIGGYRQGRTSYALSARTRLEQHYQTAIYAWRSGYRTVAMDELGRAIHYLIDICTPTHTAAHSLPHVGQHSQYESWVDSVQANRGPWEEDGDSYDYWLSSGNNWLPDSSYTYYNLMVNQTFETICDRLSENAAPYSGVLDVSVLDKLEKIYLPENVSILNAYKTAASVTLPMAQGAVAGLLNRFYIESHETQKIENNGYYRIKNVGSGKYLNVSGDSITTANYSGNDAQKFRLSFDSTYCGFRVYAVQSEKYLTDFLINGLGVTTSYEGVKNCFLPVNINGGSYFRIMHDGAFLSKLIGADKKSKDNIEAIYNFIWREDYLPTNTFQLWEIIAA